MTSSANELLTSLDAEQGLLASILSKNDLVWDIANAVTAEDFAWPVHGEIFSACRDLVTGGGKASVTTLRMKFTGHAALEAVGGASYLVELVTEHAMLGTASEYAKIVADLSQRRKIVEALDAVRRRVISENANGAEILADLSRILERPSDSPMRTKRQVAIDAINALSIPAECYATGIEALDKSMFGGLYAGFTYGLGGAEKRGKTTLAHTVSQNLNDAGVLHAYLALEMGSAQIEQRNLARKLGINSLRFLQRKAGQDTDLVARGMAAAQSGNDCTLYLDMPSGTLEAIQVELSRLVMRYGIKGFILDYWQLVEGQQRNETEERHLRRVAQWLASFARKHGVWCILLSQVNDEGKLFAGKGLVKACDQLYTIELGETGSDDQELWLKMTHSRYTPLLDVGSASRPLLFINKKAGPHVEQHFAVPELDF